jgi:hypothetical protein
MIMNHRTLPVLLLVLFSSLIPHPSSLARADGGALRLRQRAGNHQIAVFTSPTPFRVGPVDVSVLVQDAATGECVPETQVMLRLTSRASGQVLEYLATVGSATNKLFHAAEFQLPEPGSWDVDVVVEGPHGRALIRFEVTADEPPPRWLDLWPWFVWPALTIALFGIHQVLVQRRGRAAAGRHVADPQIVELPHCPDCSVASSGVKWECGVRASAVSARRIPRRD